MIVEAALAPAVVEADVHAPVFCSRRRDEPNSRVGVREVFVIAKQSALAIGHHKDSAARRASDRKQRYG
jgi:hypothetical protein